MSTISGSCSESPSISLFKQGIEQDQVKSNEEQRASKNQEKLNITSSQSLTEPHLGNFINEHV